MGTREFFAHSGQRPDKSDWQPLAVHLRKVARLAKGFAEGARPGDEEFAQAAWVAGMLHDLGKEVP
jgi:CRISPR-associated endonuclease/helicase Cas3